MQPQAWRQASWAVKPSSPTTSHRGCHSETQSQSFQGTPFLCQFGLSTQPGSMDGRDVVGDADGTLYISPPSRQYENLSSSSPPRK